MITRPFFVAKVGASGEEKKTLAPVCRGRCFANGGSRWISVDPGRLLLGVMAYLDSNKWGDRRSIRSENGGGTEEGGRGGGGDRARETVPEIPHLYYILLLPHVL